MVEKQAINMLKNFGGADKHNFCLGKNFAAEKKLSNKKAYLLQKKIVLKIRFRCRLADSPNPLAGCLEVHFWEPKPHSAGPNRAMLGNWFICQTTQISS
jgi:hypothetical protein